MENLPFWTTRQFRWFALVAVMAAAVLAVLVFEIGPLIDSRNRPPLSIGIWGDEANFGNGYACVGNDPANKNDPYGILGKICLGCEQANGVRIRQNIQGLFSLQIPLQAGTGAISVAFDNPGRFPTGQSCSDIVIGHLHPRSDKILIDMTT